MKPDEKNKKNLELTRVQLGLATFTVLGTYGSAAILTPQNAKIFNKVVNVLSTIVDTAFGIAEQQTQNDEKE